MDLQLSDIFIPLPDKQYYSKQELLALEIKQDFIQKMERQLDLNYLESENSDSNVCFANHEQLRHEFKMFFSKADIVEFLNRMLPKEDFNIDIDKVPFPRTGEHFWQSIS